MRSLLSGVHVGVCARGEQGQGHLFPTVGFLAPASSLLEFPCVPLASDASRCPHPCPPPQQSLGWARQGGFHPFPIAGFQQPWHRGGTQHLPLRDGCSCKDCWFGRNKSPWLVPCPRRWGHLVSLLLLIAVEPDTAHLGGRAGCGAAAGSKMWPTKQAQQHPPPAQGAGRGWSAALQQNGFVGEESGLWALLWNKSVCAEASCGVARGCWHFPLRCVACWGLPSVALPRGCAFTGSSMFYWGKWKPRERLWMCFTLQPWDDWCVFPFAGEKSCLVVGFLSGGGHKALCALLVVYPTTSPKKMHLLLRTWMWSLAVILWFSRSLIHAVWWCSYSNQHTEGLVSLQQQRKMVCVVILFQRWRCPCLLSEP